MKEVSCDGGRFRKEGNSAHICQNHLRSCARRACRLVAVQKGVSRCVCGTDQWHLGLVEMKQIPSFELLTSQDLSAACFGQSDGQEVDD